MLAQARQADIMHHARSGAAGTQCTDLMCYSVLRPLCHCTVVMLAGGHRRADRLQCYLFAAVADGVGLSDVSIKHVSNGARALLCSSFNQHRTCGPVKAHTEFLHLLQVH